MAGLDPNKWTAKVQEAFKRAQEQASDNGHQQIAPVHLALALLEDAEGLGHQVRLQIVWC